jgi:hypothetical protein
VTLRRVTLEDFLTLPLPERIKWLHSEGGPRGYLSHDSFAALLGTARQTVIGWEKGTEPKQYAEALAEFSGFPAWAFGRREAEGAVASSVGDRLRVQDGRLERVEGDLADALLAQATLTRRVAGCASRSRTAA